MNTFSHWRSSAKAGLTTMRRPRIEVLESRLAPALLDAFFPSAVVEVNPQPLPPGVLPQLDLLPAPDQFITPATPAQMTDTPFELHGHFTETITPPPGSAQQGSWFLDFLYEFKGELHENMQPQGTDSRNAILTASYSMTGNTQGEVLVAFDHGDVRQPYVIGSLWNATGGLTGIVHPPDPSTGAQEIDTIFQSKATISETVVQPGQPALLPWTVAAVVDSQGSGTVRKLVGRERFPSIILKRGVVHENLWQNNSSGGMGPIWTKDATFSLAGAIDPQLHSSGPTQVMMGTAALSEELTGIVTSPGASATVPQTTPISFQGQGLGQFQEVLVSPGPNNMPPPGASGSSRGNEHSSYSPTALSDFFETARAHNHASISNDDIFP